jgi:hypothetical protein
MRQFRGVVRLGIVGCNRPFEFEADDDATEAEIEDMAFQSAMELVEWDYEEVK